MNGKALEDVAPAQKEPSGGIGENHFPGTEALAFGDTGFFQIDQTGFGAGDEQAVVREGVAQRAKAVAIELGADKLAVGKDEGGGAVPGLALLRKGGQRAADIARKQRIFFKGGRNHGAHGFFRGEAFEETKFEGVVETGGIADVFLEKREPRAYGKARAEFGSFSAEPAAVGDDGIDLAVVCDVAEGLGEMPGRLRVGRIALMKDVEGDGEPRIAQVVVELRELPRREQSLVSDGLRGKRADVRARRQERFRALSEERQSQLEARCRARWMESFDEKLPNLWHRFEGAAAQRMRVCRNAAPANDAEALGVRSGFDGSAGFVEHGGRKKGEAHREHFGELNSLLLRTGTEEWLRKRSEQTGAVAAGAVGVNSSTVGEAL